jgi:nitric oxide reductase large subunit
VRFVAPASVALTPAQRVTAWFFLVVAALFLIQNLVVVATVRYMVEAGGGLAVEMALGAFFSATEVIPLTLLTVEAWSFLQLSSQQDCCSAWVAWVDRRPERVPLKPPT